MKLANIKLIAISNLILLLLGCARTGDYVQPVDGPIATIEFVNQTSGQKGTFTTYKEAETCTGAYYIKRDIADIEGVRIHLLNAGERKNIKFVGDKNHAFYIRFRTKEVGIGQVNVIQPGPPLSGYSYLKETTKELFSCNAFISFKAVSKNKYQVIISDPNNSYSEKCDVKVYKVMADANKLAIKHYNRIYDPNPHDANSTHCKPL